MKPGSKALTWNDRLALEALLKAKLKPAQIAAQLGEAPCTIYREMKRGRYKHLNHDYTEEWRYSPDLAERKYQAGLRCRGKDLKIGNDHEYAEYLEYKVSVEGYSPGAALGEIKRDADRLKFKTTISKTTFYRYIDNGVFYSLTVKDLPLQGKRKKKTKSTPRLQKRVSRGDSIDKRPPEVLTRKEIGHWEMDCIEGKKGTKKTLLVLTERKTRYEIIRLMKDKTVVSVIGEINKLERELGIKRFRKIFKTITVDNGSEFSDPAALETGLQGAHRTKLFYCHAYHSWERGSNENANGLIRRHFPKGMSFAHTSRKAVAKVEAWLNHYPREILGWYSSDMLFDAELARL